MCASCFGNGNGDVAQSHAMAAIKDELMRDPVLRGTPQELAVAIEKLCRVAGVLPENFAEWIYLNGLNWSRLAISADTPDGLKMPLVVDYRLADKVVDACQQYWQ